MAGRRRSPTASARRGRTAGPARSRPATTRSGYYDIVLAAGQTSANKDFGNFQAVGSRPDAHTNPDAHSDTDAHPHPNSHANPDSHADADRRRKRDAERPGALDAAVGGGRGAEGEGEGSRPDDQRVVPTGRRAGDGATVHVERRDGGRRRRDAFDGHEEAEVQARPDPQDADEAGGVPDGRRRKLPAPAQIQAPDQSTSVAQAAAPVTIAAPFVDIAASLRPAPRRAAHPRRASPGPSWRSRTSATSPPTTTLGGG